MRGVIRMANADLGPGRLATRHAGGREGVAAVLFSAEIASPVMGASYMAPRRRSGMIAAAKTRQRPAIPFVAFEGPAIRLPEQATADRLQCTAAAHGCGDDGPTRGQTRRCGPRNRDRPGLACLRSIWCSREFRVQTRSTCRLGSALNTRPWRRCSRAQRQRPLPCRDLLIQLADERPWLLASRQTLDATDSAALMSSLGSAPARSFTFYPGLTLQPVIPHTANSVSSALAPCCGRPARL